MSTPETFATVVDLTDDDMEVSWVQYSPLPLIITVEDEPPAQQVGFVDELLAEEILEDILWFQPTLHEFIEIHWEFIFKDLD